MRLKKALGQHLLVAKDVLSKIAQLIDPKEDEVLLEIGPGTGNLTKEVLKYPFKEIHLLELDPQMVNFLMENLKDPRIRIHNEDARYFDFCSLSPDLKVFGNLPYNVASLIVERTIFQHRCVREAVYMLQKEVGEKLKKGPSWLSTFVRTFYHVDYLMSLPARFFRPPPKVQSALLRFTRKENPPQMDLENYKAFLTKLYSSKRKALKSKLPEELLISLNIDPMLRVEALKLEEVLLLYNTWQK
ncbi:MAG: ribosomal RNA small subunit methyltransferase A [Acidobacteria bacterium]|jgi:16S rRNA (adenine1518-N6/adenine1519-N6)-dimethyltransferase|nr:MAG: ribosomal RNA small subunit methyltransferase A [Acidobacteriota bacterium]